MNCPICKLELQNFNEELAKHLAVFKGVNNAIHVHGPLENKELMKQFINEILIHSGLADNFKEVISTIKDRKEIVFHNRQRLGDILMFTSGIRDFKKIFPDIRVNVISTAGHIWDHNPYIDRTLIPTEENTIKIGPGRLTNASNRLDWHFANAFRLSIEDALNIHIPQGESRPDIWLTKEEYDAPRMIEQPYWIMVLNGERGWGCKMYPFERWQEFVSQNKDVFFVQVGTNEDNPPRLQGENVIDYVGKTQDRDTGIRDLFKLFLNAEGSIGLVSFHMHLSGGLYKPAIVIAGAREPVSFTRYQGHQYLATEGCLSCSTISACWHCNIDTCPQLVIDDTKEHIGDRKVPKCVDIIYPEDITRALNMYYLGGRLQKGVVSKKPEFKNIVKAPIVVPVAIEIEKVIPKIENKYEIPFGNGSLTIEDWEFMQTVIKENNVKTVLEFGAGLSTLLLSDMGLKVLSFETMDGWIKKLKTIKSELDIRLWDGKNCGISGHVDMAFVDGPSGGASREISTKIASELSDIVIIHDASRSNELNWQETYLKGKFYGPGGGGKRCHIWAKDKNVKMSLRTGSPLYIKTSTTSPSFGMTTKPTPSRDEIYPPILDSEGKCTIGNSTFPIKELTGINVIISKSKSIKFVFNGRGEGGAENSVTWMMNKLVELGHKVTYHTPNPQPCGTFRKYGSKDVLVEDCKTLHEACDILVLYSNDWVWNFDKSEICDIFSNINAGRKVFCVNYRIDKIGLIEWTKGWNSYLFLNSNLEKILLERYPDAKTKVMAPPTDLTKYFEIIPDYTNGIRLIRHSSQGDSKYPKDFNEIIEKILTIRNDVSIRLMPAPSFIGNFDSRVFVHQRNNPSISEFLKLGNCFFYILPLNYSEGGPKVVMEAQATGLPIIADNHSGMKDRVVEGTGWLANSIEEYLSIIKNVTSSDLEQYGKNAREHARVEYNPMNWIDNILESV